MLGDRAPRRTSSAKKRPSGPLPLKSSDAGTKLPAGPAQQGVKRPAEQSSNSNGRHAFDDGGSSQENGHEAKRQKVVPSPQIAKTIREQYGDMLAMPSLLYNPKVIELCETIFYSARYYDDVYEYRHVHIPKQLLDYIPGKWRGRILADEEWRSIGILQSPGWVNYMYHAPEPHVFLFRREKNYQEKYCPETISQQPSSAEAPPEEQEDPYEEEDPYGDAEDDDNEAEGLLANESNPSPEPENQPEPPKRGRGRPRKSTEVAVTKESDTKQQSAATKLNKGPSRRALQELSESTVPTNRVTRSASSGSQQASVKRELRERKSTGGQIDSQGSAGARKSARKK